MMTYDDVSTRTIREAIDLGITFFDTAEMYGPFRNEELLGNAIKGRREGLVIATKFAMRWDGDTPVGVDGSPENARRACEGSLRRLGIVDAIAAVAARHGVSNAQIALAWLLSRGMISCRSRG